MSLPNPGMDFTALDPLTAAEMDDMVENIEALADGSGLDDGAVTSAKIALNEAATATIASSQTSSSTSYTNLGTVGPSVTTDIGTSGIALVIVGVSETFNNTNGGQTYISFEVSGANTLAALDANAFRYGIPTVGSGMVSGASKATLLTGLNPGSTTFTAKYKVTTGTGTWNTRSIIVIPL